MRQILVILHLLLSCLLCSAATPQKQPAQTQQGKTQQAPKAVEPKPFIVVIDAGHGGKDPGAGKKELREKTVNLAVALKLGKLLENQKGVKVYYTRKTDDFVTLQDRAIFANKKKANLFISIHANATKKSSVRGTEVYTFSSASTDVAMNENSAMELEENYKEKYDGFDPRSSESYIQWQLVSSDFGNIGHSKDFAKYVSAQFRKHTNLPDRGIREAGFWVLKYSNMPGVLVELGYLSNKEDEKFLKSSDNQAKLATAISKAVEQYKKEYDKKEGMAAKEQEIVEKQQNSGIHYRVQFYSGARKDVNSKDFKGCVPARESEQDDCRYIYTYGDDTTLCAARKTLADVRYDFKDAFLVVFKDGERLSRSEAAQYLVDKKPEKKTPEKKDTVNAKTSQKKDNSKSEPARKDSTKKTTDKK